MRRTSTGTLEVLLVTSRSARRWVIPKGWPWPGHADHAAAAGEAHEEAGLLGRIETISFGSYVYSKKAPSNSIEIAVDVYLLWVGEELADWPERAERSRAWYAPNAAAEAVEEPQLRAMLRAVGDLPQTR